MYVIIVPQPPPAVDYATPHWIYRIDEFDWSLVVLVSCCLYGDATADIQLLMSDGEAAAKGGSNTKLFKILRMARLAKLLRVASLYRLVRRYAEDFEGLEGFFKLLSTLSLALFIAHILACVWFYAGSSPEGTNVKPRNVSIRIVVLFIHLTIVY